MRQHRCSPAFKGIGAIALIAAVGASQDARAGQWSFERIRSQSEGVPGAPGLDVVFNAPAFDGSSIAFRVREFFDYDGVYVIDSNGDIDLVADINTHLTVLDDSPDRFMEPSIDAGRIVVVAPVDPFDSIILYQDGRISVAVSIQTPAPGGPGFFTNLFRARVDGDCIAYTGRSFLSGGPSREGVFVHDITDDTDHCVIASDDAVPGFPGEEWFTFETPDIGGDDIAFHGRLNKPNSDVIFAVMDGEVMPIVSEYTEIPEAEGTFDRAQTPLIENRVVAFHGRRTGGGLHEGIYTYTDGTFERIVDSETLIPDGSTSFLEIRREFSMHHGNFAFVASSDNDPESEGLFAVFDGELSTVLRPGDELDGHVVNAILFQSEGLHDRTIAFVALFEDAPAAIYTATLIAQGDANGDRRVDMADLNLVLGNFLRTGAPGLPGDPTDDGMVDLNDLNLVLDNFGAGCD